MTTAGEVMTLFWYAVNGSCATAEFDRTSRPMTTPSSSVGAAISAGASASAARAIRASAESAADGSDKDDLLAVEGIDAQVADVLNEAGIRTATELADLATDELLESVEMDEAAASELIMAARRRVYA